jgi:glycosyltransferase involved in cell wall biosynthesis
MTSKFEGISITTVEAMSCNIPAILYDVPGLRDFNKDGKNCILIPEDIQMLADSVIRLRDHKIEIVKMTEKANILVNEKFDIVNNVDRIYDMYL